MSSTSTCQKERCNSRGSHTEDNLHFSTKSSSNEVAEICLATSTSTVDKVCTTYVKSCIPNHCIIDSSLVLIESRDSCIHKLLEIALLVKPELLGYQLVALQEAPPLCHFWDWHERVAI